MLRGWEWRGSGRWIRGKGSGDQDEGREMGGGKNKRKRKCKAMMHWGDLKAITISRYSVMHRVLSSSSFHLPTVSKAEEIQGQGLDCCSRAHLLYSVQQLFRNHSAFLQLHVGTGVEYGPRTYQRFSKLFDTL
jgi:hypothetical protein